MFSCTFSSIHSNGFITVISHNGGNKIWWRTLEFDVVQTRSFRYWRGKPTVLLTSVHRDPDLRTNESSIVKSLRLSAVYKSINVHLGQGQDLIMSIQIYFKHKYTYENAGFCILCIDEFKTLKFSNRLSKFSVIFTAKHHRRQPPHPPTFIWRFSWTKSICDASLTKLFSCTFSSIHSNGLYYDNFTQRRKQDLMKNTWIRRCPYALLQILAREANCPIDKCT